jgi:Transposase IS66 family
MTEPEEVKPRWRRTRQEVQRLVGEFEVSGLSRGEFCRIHGMTLSTLQRGLKRGRTELGDIQRDGKRLVRVKVIGGSGTADREGPCAITVVLAKGRRIELNRDFDAGSCAAYDQVGGPKIVHAACWAHARRKFFQAVELNPKDQDALRTILARSCPAWPTSRSIGSPSSRLQLGWLATDRPNPVE